MTTLEDGRANLPCVEAGEIGPPPQWALLQRTLLDTLHTAAYEFIDRYTYQDGTLQWRPQWPGMDGSDDPYEGFYGLPLLYLLGGDARLLPRAHYQWDAITWQWTEYGQIYREFDAYYDWMHHGESNLYFYLLGLADPASLRHRQRAVRFASFYIGDDPTAPNYDAAKRLLRSPLTGSRGPRLTTTAEDWSTHRETLDAYPPPFEDIPGVKGPTCQWTDEAIYAEILQRINARMTRGDVPLNLTSTSLITHAYLATGDERYRQWVLEYHAAWEKRTARNGGILPDNVGLDDKIGQYMDGKWWGGYYGWRWPHGAATLLEPVTISGCNALLVDHGNPAHLNLIRSQLDLLWSLGKEENGRRVIPYKHLDSGWAQYQPPRPQLPIYCWYISQEQEDLQRVLRLHEYIKNLQPSKERAKGNGSINSVQWFQFIQGQNPNYPLQILQENYAQVLQQLAAIRADQANPGTIDIHHWQNKNPLVCEGLVQTMLGAPLNIYHGGLLFTTVRYFDEQTKHPGLPPQVGALVEHLDAHSVTLHLINLDVQQKREVIVQAGCFGEHMFHQAFVLANDGTKEATQAIEGKWLCVSLAPGNTIRLYLEMSRFVNRPSNETPWEPQRDYPALLKGREGNSELF